MNSSVQWRSVNFSSLKIEEWNEEFTVFQSDSGKTHFLNLMSMQIISSLNQSRASTEAINQLLAKQFQLTFNEDFSSHIDEILHRFEALGLIEKIK